MIATGTDALRPEGDPESRLWVAVPGAEDIELMLATEADLRPCTPCWLLLGPPERPGYQRIAAYDLVEAGFDVAATANAGGVEESDDAELLYAGIAGEAVGDGADDWAEEEGDLMNGPAKVCQ